MEDRTEATDDTKPNWPQFARRPILRALGMGSAATLAGSGTALAAARGDVRGDGQERSGEGDNDDSPRPPVLDPQLGYSVLPDESTPNRLTPDYTVGLHTDEEKIDTSNAPEVTTEFGAFHFEYAGLHVEQDSIVSFDFASPEHTVTAYHLRLGRQQRVPDGVLPATSPVLDEGGQWLYKFEEPGVYDLFCTPHDPFGMAMRIVVGDVTEPVVRELGRPPAGLSAILLGLGQSGPPDNPSIDNTAIGIDALAPTNIKSEGEITTEDIAEDVPFEITLGGPTHI